MRNVLRAGDEVPTMQGYIVVKEVKDASSAYCVCVEQMYDECGNDAGETREELLLTAVDVERRIYENTGRIWRVRFERDGESED